MRRARRQFLKAATLATLAAGSNVCGLFGQDPAGRKRGIALTIGLNRVDSGHYGSPMPLRGCVNDARDLFAIARQRGFQCFEALTDDKATRAEVIGNIRTAAKELKSGDLFLLHYSGHGASIADRNFDEPDGRDETWCLYDGMLLDDELYRLWAEFQPGVRIVVLSDSCHSGTVTRGQAFRAAVRQGDVGGGRGVRGVLESVPDAEMGFRFVPDEEADETVARNKPFYEPILAAVGQEGDEREDLDSRGPNVPASVLLISGCQDNQLSGDLPGNGVFTASVKRIWGGGQFTGSWRAFHAALVRVMPQTQSPNFYPLGVPDPRFWAQTPFTI